MFNTDDYIHSRLKYSERNTERIKKILNGEIPKHIIIAGVPRGGKTTTCSLLSCSGKYQHLCMDAVIRAFERDFPQLNITTYTDNPDTMVQDVSQKIAPFINSIVTANNYDKLPYKLVLDLLELTPKDYSMLIDSRLCDVYFFGVSELSPTENFNRIRTYDTKEDYTYYLSDDDLMQRCKRFFKLSKYLKEECKNFNLPFIDTSYNREEKIKSLVNKILV